MIRNAISYTALALLVGAGPACDGDDEDSPPVTFEQAPERAVAPGQDDPEASGDQPPPAAGEAEETAELDAAEAGEATAAPGARNTDRHVAELPEGTDEQQSQLMEGRKAFLDDEYRDAEEVFEELAFDEPITSETVSAVVALSQIYLETGRSEQALELFDELEEHVGDIPEVLLVLARAYEDLGHSDEAIAAYDRAFEQKRDYIFILPEMAEILLREGRGDQAAEILLEYEEYVEELVAHLDPDEADEQERVYVADVFAMVSDERAHEALQEALVDDPSEAVRTQAAIALGEGAAFEAREALQRASTEDDSESVRTGAKRALHQLDRFEEQFEDLEQQQ